MEELKKYKYKLVFKDRTEINGECEFENLDKVYSFFLKNNFSQLANNTKGFYYNSDEILYFEVKEVEGE